MSTSSTTKSKPLRKSFQSSKGGEPYLLKRRKTITVLKHSAKSLLLAILTLSALLINPGNTTCPKDCKSCSDPKKCTECDQNFKKLTLGGQTLCTAPTNFAIEKICTTILGRKFCTKDCKENEFLTRKNSCKLCSSQPGNGQCVKCLDLIGACEQCHKDYTFLSIKDRFCKKQCGEDEYWSGRQANVCRKCKSLTNNRGCSTCEDISGKCTNCEQDFTLNQATGACTKQCKDSQYLRDQDSTFCDECSQVNGNNQCRSCEDFTGSCLRCNTGFEFDKGSTFCRKSCKEDEYWEGRLTNRCAPCSSNTPHCLRCRDLDGVCTSCVPKYKLNPATSLCDRVCLEGTFKVQGRPGKAITCRECSEVSTSGKACVACSSDGTVCLKCLTGYKLNKINFCQKVCQRDEFWTGEDLNLCVKCSKGSKGCSRCVERSGGCLACSSQFQFDDGKCSPKCVEPGTFWSVESQDCLECPKNCFKCDPVKMKCLLCNPNFKVNKETGECEELPKDAIAQLMGVYYDKVENTIKMVFNQNLTQENIPGNMVNLSLKLSVFGRGMTRAPMSYSLPISEDTLKGKLRTLSFEMPFEEVNQANLTIFNDFKESEYNLGKNSRIGGKDASQASVSSLGGDWGAGAPPWELFEETIHGVSYYNPPTKRVIQVIALLVNIVAMVFSLISLFLNMPVFVSLVNISQIIHQLKFVDTSFPSNFLSVIDSFKANVFTVGPSYLFKLPVLYEESVTGCKVDPRFYAGGVGCVVTVSPVVLILIIIVILAFGYIISGILYISAKYATLGKDGDLNALRMKPPKNRSNGELTLLRLASLSEFFSIRFITYFLMATQLDVLTRVFVSLKSGGFNLKHRFLNTTLSVISGLVYAALTLLLIAISVSKSCPSIDDSTEEENTKTEGGNTVISHISDFENFRKFRTLISYNEFRKEIFGGIHHPMTNLLFVLSNWVFSAVMVFADKSVDAQLLVISAAALVYAIWLVLAHPFKQWFLLTSFYKYLSLSIIFVIAFFSQQKRSQMTERIRYNSDGYLLSFMVCSIIVVNLVAAFLMWVDFLRKRWMKKRKGKKKGDKKNWRKRGSQGAGEEIRLKANTLRSRRLGALGYNRNGRAEERERKRRHDVGGGDEGAGRIRNERRKDRSRNPKKSQSRRKERRA